MEPTISNVHIDNEIKFKKADVELKVGKLLTSQYFCVCNISNVKYTLWIYKGHHTVNIKVVVKSGKATNIIADLEYSILSSPECSKTVKWEYTKNEKNGMFCSISKYELDTEKCNIYIDDELIVKIKGSFKIALPSIMKYPISATWKIKVADLEALRTSEDGSLKSKCFDVSRNPDIEYSLEIYPNGNTCGGVMEENRGQAIINFYARNRTNRKIRVDTVFNLSIDSANYSCNNPYKVCSTDDLFNPDNRYFVDGEMTLTITGVLLVEKEKVDPTILKCGKAIEADQKCNGKDFAIEVWDKKIMVHKQLLLESSPYFIGLFNSGMIESFEMKTTITDFDYEIVEAAINLLYNPSKIPSNLNFEQMLELLRFSDKYDIQLFTFEQMLELLQFSNKYDIQLVKDLVQNYLIERLSPMNVCPLMNYTKTTVDAPILKKKCMEFLVKCMEEKKAVHGLETLDKETMLKILIGTSAQSLQFSNKYDIQLVKDIVQNHLIEKLSPMNVCPLIIFTKTTVDAPFLYKKCMEFLIKCMEEKKAVHGIETLDKEILVKILIGISAHSL